MVVLSFFGIGVESGERLCVCWFGEYLNSGFCISGWVGVSRRFVCVFIDIGFVSICLGVYRFVFRVLSERGRLVFGLWFLEGMI